MLAPSLSGMADRHHIASEGMGLHTHVDDLVRLIQWEQLHDIVLVGHSYGGMVVTGVAASVPDRIAHLVYLDAFLPRPDESAWDILTWQREAFQPLRLSDRPWLVQPVDMAAFFPELGADFDTGRFTPMPLATHEKAVGAAPEPGSVPATYVHSTSPGFFDASAARAAADGMTVIDIEAGHMLISTHPDDVTALLLDAEAADRA